jgi:opacity protein-like surface antigen
LSGAVLVLLSLSICTNSAEAHESEGEPSSSTPDFRFKQPRVTLGIRAGASFNRSKGDIYDFFSEELTLGDSDFDSGVFAFDVGVWVTERIDVVFGFEASGDYQKSEFRSFEEDNGNAIEQKTRLTQIPLTISAKLYPLGRGRKVGDYAWIRSRLVPYLGGGIGTTYYQLKQKGDFVDFMDLTIFESKLESEDWGFSQHVFVGLDIKLTRNFGLVFEGRYYWADADLEGDFSDFDSIDLDGARAMAGLSWRL